MDPDETLNEMGRAFGLARYAIYEEKDRPFGIRELNEMEDLAFALAKWLTDGGVMPDHP